MADQSPELPSKQMVTWLQVALGDALSISTERINPSDHPDQQFNYIGLEHIEGHTGNVLPHVQSYGSEIKSTKNVFRAGQVLYGKLRPYLNKVHLADSDGICSTDIFVLRPRNGKVIPPFAAYYLRSPLVLGRIEHLMQGANLPRLSPKTMLSFPFPLPPLPAQKRIVKLLDAEEELRRLRAEADRRTADLIPAIFHEMFGDFSNGHGSWPRKALRDILSNIDSGWSPKCPDRSAGPDEWGVLKLGAVTSCRYIDTENKVLSEGDQPRPHLEVKPGDLLFTRKNTYDLVAACALVDRSRPNLMLSDLIFRLRIREGIGILPEYLWAALTNRSVRSQVQRLAGGSAGSMPNISKGRLYNFSIPVPPVTLQRQFAARVAEVRDLEAKQAASRQRLDDLFQSMLHRAFRGEL